MPEAGGGPAVVTGGAGAVGSSLVRALLARGAEVRVIDDLSSGRRDHLPSTDGRLSLTVADVREPTGYADRFTGATEVWHLAANSDVRRGSENPRVDFDQGLDGTFRVLDAARRRDVPRFLYTSSSTVYGMPTVVPTPETYGPLLPESFYGGTKLGSEGLVSAFAHAYGFRAWVFRFANIIGPRMTHGIFYDFFEKLRRDPTRLEVLGDGRQSKSYLRTEECVEGLLVARDRASETVNVFNLGSYDQTSVREIAEKVVAVHGGRARIEYTGGSRGWVGDVPQQLLSVEKIGRLGWKPRLSSSAAVDRTVDEVARERGVVR